MIVSDERGPRVFLYGDVYYEYTRRILEGVSDYGHQLERPWDLRWGRHLLPRRILLEQGYTGVICFGSSRREADQLRRRGLPAVSTSNQSATFPLPRVVADDRAIGRMAARHFQERLYREFRYVGYEAHAYSQQRLEGFLDQLGLSEIPVYSEAPASPDPADPEEALTAFLLEAPEGAAVFCASDALAHRVVTVCARAGLSIPEQRAVLGVDNDSLLVLTASCPLSSIDPNFREVGRRAARCLDRLIRGEAPDTTLERVPPSGLQLRRSSDRLATRDAVVAEAVDLIQREAVEGLDVEKLCRRIGVGRRAFERRFRQVLDLTPDAVLRQVRLERAAQLLAESPLTVGEIGEAAGFTDRFHFSSSFRRAYGVSPRAWRNLPAGKRPGYSR
jgi:LacI family transcriptional regulator